ncbi:hypothetical protein CTA2_1752 [Colletotrichum tanaceti]|uniref:Uncharacterized protein n=1 Tax=Colletotrichum tanaceti TaxID=1306861 RepID=A0A4U6XKY3_9PEZI|nr:hypothetical protein CTA2_1752 [Colletotrichum tanaceti]TKW56264.1 hypothetical protein CTA1_11905 [Colletotrichum tanaceti]
MKYTAATLLALVAVSNAAVCNGGWDKPKGSTCPGAYMDAGTIELLVMQLYLKTEQ